MEFGEGSGGQPAPERAKSVLRKAERLLMDPLEKVEKGNQDTSPAACSQPPQRAQMFGSLKPVSCEPPETQAVIFWACICYDSIRNSYIMVKQLKLNLLMLLGSEHKDDSL